MTESLYIQYEAALTYMRGVGEEVFLSPAGAVGPGREILQRPPFVCLSVCLSVRPSVTFSFRTVTQKRIAVFSRNFAGTCTKWWGCALFFDIDGMLFEFFMNFLNI